MAAPPYKIQDSQDPWLLQSASLAGFEHPNHGRWQETASCCWGHKRTGDHHLLFAATYSNIHISSPAATATIPSKMALLKTGPASSSGMRKVSSTQPLSTAATVSFVAWPDLHSGTVEGWPPRGICPSTRFGLPPWQRSQGDDCRLTLQTGYPCYGQVYSWCSLKSQLIDSVDERMATLESCSSATDAWLWALAVALNEVLPPSYWHPTVYLWWGKKISADGIIYTSRAFLRLLQALTFTPQWLPFSTNFWISPWLQN